MKSSAPEMAMMSAAPMQLGMAAAESSACDDDMMIMKSSKMMR